jgi:hypothetical protein
VNQSEDVDDDIVNQSEDDIEEIYSDFEKEDEEDDNDDKIVKVADNISNKSIDNNKNDSPELHGALSVCPAHRVGPTDFPALQKAAQHLERPGRGTEKGRG